MKTLAADVFSLEVLGYFAISEGEHLFGDPIDRQRNIANAKPIFDDEKYPQSFYKAVLAKELIINMTKRDPFERPSANDILDHPYFWDEDKMTRFIQDVSDHLSGKKASSGLKKRLEINANLIIGDDWRNKIDILILSNVEKYNKFYKCSAIRTLKSLLRVIRNHVKFS